MSLETLIHQGRYFEARMKAEGALSNSANLRLKQLYALSLSKSGSPEAALEYMERVYQEVPQDPESAGILASINKELFKKNRSNQFAIRSRDTYWNNFEVTKNYYTGINAATMSAIAGQASRARQIAAEVITILQNEPADFWTLATLGEAHLILKDREKSLAYYTQARKLAGNDWGRITSVHNQLWLLNHYLPVSEGVMKMFKPPVVAAFTGHMIDSPNRTSPRFPAEIEGAVKDAIVNSLKSLNARIGYCSLACGGDILFAEAMASLDGEVNIFLPFQMEDFIKISVAFAGEDWVNRFKVLVERFPITYATQHPYEGHADLFSFQSKVIFGAATLRSQAQFSEPSLVTVMSETDLKQKEGGTRDTLKLWPYLKNHVNINPEVYLNSSSKVQAIKSEISSDEKLTISNRPVLYLACFDYALLPIHLRDGSIKAMKLKMMESASLKAIIEGSDSLVVAYDQEGEAISFVKHMVLWSKSNKLGVSLKGGLHAGPVFLSEEVEVQKVEASGIVIDQLRELVKLIPAGSIGASSLFASLLALDRSHYELEYAGTLLIDKDSHEQSVYSVSFVL